VLLGCSETLTLRRAIPDAARWNRTVPSKVDFEPPSEVLAFLETALVLTVWIVVSLPIALLVCGAIKVGEGDTPSGDENVRDGSAHLAEEIKRAA
jgi:hypothetical protein